MLKRAVLFLVVIGNGIAVNCQAQQGKRPAYADFVTSGDKLFVVPKKGTVQIFDANTGIAIDTNIHANAPITALNTDRKGNIIAVRKDKQVDVLDKNGKVFKTLFTSTDNIYNVVFGKNNDAYLITDKGITITSTGKTYSPDTSFMLNRHFRQPWVKPTAIVIDNDGKIWVGSDYGEFAGELYSFDTKATQFVKLDITSIRINRFSLIELYGVQAILAVNNSVYVGFDFGNTHPDGHLLKFTGAKRDSIYLSNDIWPVQKVNADGGVLVWEGEYAGPAVYNEKDKCIYFYSHYGIFKGQISAGLSNPSAWVQFPASQLNWVSHAPKTAGVNVIKMSFAKNGKLYLLSENDGIGVFDGKTIKVLN